MKSAIGYPKDQKRTIRALGLHTLNQTVVQDDSSPVRGMVKKVSHLVNVQEVAD
jgi:large subunit ribosomal protein L30